MISVVIPLYNKEKQIGNTLRTVLNQTFQDFEIVVVNDGSTDNSAAEVERFHDQRIRLVHQANAGVSAARNRGVEESKYELIAFLDADDEWKPLYLETQYSLYKKYPECSVFACNYEFRDANGNTRPTIIRKLPFQEIDGILSNYFEVASCSHPPLWTSAIVAKKSALMYVGGFPVGIKSGEDLLTWARLAMKYKIVFCQTPLSTFISDAKLFNDDQKQRMPEKNYDYVGMELHRLYINNQGVVGIKAYNALWHKMRARIYLDKEFRMMALKECVCSAKYNLNLKILAFICISLLPYKIIHYIFKN